MRRVLVTGASIAGPAVAWWLDQYGFEVTVVERAKEFRQGGQTIDIRGAARTVVKRMGMEDLVRRRTVEETSWDWVDERGRIVASFKSSELGGEGPTAEVEVLRGELAKLLIDEAPKSIRYVFGDAIESLTESSKEVRVRFKSGDVQTFDAVIIAEGIGSSTRQMLWGSEAQKRPLNLYTAYFTIPKGATDSSAARWFNTIGARTVFLRPDNTGTTRAVFNYLCKPNGLEKKSTDEQKQVLAQKFAGAGWETPRVVEGMQRSTDFYFEAIGQMKVSHWAKGNVVLLGDAAYCASPLSGMGTALALVGAYILAGELAQHAEPQQAYAAYERIMRPYVDKAQNVPDFAPRFGQPESRFGIFLQRAALRIASTKVFQKIGGSLLKTSADKIDLPNYGSSESVDKRRQVHAT